MKTKQWLFLKNRPNFEVDEKQQVAYGTWHNIKVGISTILL